MFSRQALLAALLVSGTAAVAVAQSAEYPFRRFGTRNRFELRRDVHPNRFSIRNSERFRRQMEFRFRDMNRIRDRIRFRTDRFQFERPKIRMNRFHFERPKIRMDRFRFGRPMIMRRHSRTI